MTEKLFVNGVDSGARVEVARTWWQRAIGLLLTAKLEPGAGLWIDSCSSVHMFGMRYPIDVLFVDSQGRVLSFRDRLKIGRFAVHMGACASVEMSAGWREASKISVGDQLVLVPV